jgi:hypothetical protein
VLCDGVCDDVCGFMGYWKGSEVKIFKVRILEKRIRSQVVSYKIAIFPSLVLPPHTPIPIPTPLLPPPPKLPLIRPLNPPHLLLKLPLHDLQPLPLVPIPTHPLPIPPQHSHRHLQFLPLDLRIGVDGCELCLPLFGGF